MNGFEYETYTTYELHIRDAAPAEEIASALQDFGANHGTSAYTVNSEGRIYLWSASRWNCGYAIPVRK